MKITLALAVLLSFTAIAHADFKHNPDRAFSMGLDYTASKLDNAYPGLQLYDPAKGQNLVTPLNQSITSNSLILDLRAPVSESITINAHGGKLSQNGVQGSSDGYSIGAGIRYYFLSND